MKDRVRVGNKWPKWVHDEVKSALQCINPVVPGIIVTDYVYQAIARAYKRGFDDGMKAEKNSPPPKKGH